MLLGALSLRFLERCIFWVYLDMFMDIADLPYREYQRKGQSVYLCFLIFWTSPMSGVFFFDLAFLVPLVL